jgi:hypothetical protein
LQRESDENFLLAEELQERVREAFGILNDPNLSSSVQVARARLKLRPVLNLLYAPSLEPPKGSPIG